MGRAVPRALQALEIPGGIEFHDHHFAPDAPDDEWLPSVGSRGWTVIGHDSSYHDTPSELQAIKQYRVGCFYLWGAEAPRWDKVITFARAFYRIQHLDATTERPFVYRVTQMGHIRRLL